MNTLPLPKVFNCVCHQGKHRFVFIRSGYSEIPKIRAQDHIGPWVVRKVAKIVRKVLRPMMQSIAAPDKMA
jgi:hypothetical protein